MSRVTRCIRLGTIAAALVAAPAVLAQVPHAGPWAGNVVVPQARCYTFSHAPSAQIEGVRAGVVIRDQAATTMLEIRLRNPASSRIEAELLVPVPDGAVVRGFAYQGQNPEPTARLLARDEARRIYDQLVAQARDPALLEFAGYHLVRSSVFPIEPGGTQTVRLSYEQLLPADGDRIDYVLPRSESIEYTVPWQVAVSITATAPITAVYSPSHPIRTERLGGERTRVQLAAEATSDPGPFRLSFLRRRDGLSASVFAYPDPKVGGGYFLLLAGLPQADPEARSSAIRREVTLVIDRSGSMRGEKLAQVREAALQVIHGLNDGESFNVILYNEAVDAFARGPVQKSATTVRRASDFLGDMTARGGTNIHDALLEALRQPTTEGALPIVLFMTDGLPTIGQTAEAPIRELARAGNRHQRRIFTFGVGVDVNTPLLEKIAYENRGTTTFILPGEDVEVKVAGVFRRLRGPVLADPVLSEANADELVHRTRDLIPARLPDVFEGDQLVVLGQYRGDGPLEFDLRGNYRGVPRTFRIRLKLDGASTRNAFVPRLWAGRKIGLLVDAIRERGGTTAGVIASTAKQSLDPRTRELVEEVVRLSTEFGILTEYTAFLAREGTDLRKKGEVLFEAERQFSLRAVQTRTGLGSVNQDLNNQALKSMTCPNERNKYYDADMNEVTIATVQQVNDLAFYKRGARWVDSRLVGTDTESAQPARVVAFGSDEFRALAARLAREGRQGSISLRGDILMQVDGQPVLIQAPVGGSR
jgi:Ca-activated chloride channel family protein